MKTNLNTPILLASVLISSMSLPLFAADAETKSLNDCSPFRDQNREISTELLNVKHSNLDASIECFVKRENLVQSDGLHPFDDPELKALESSYRSFMNHKDAYRAAKRDLKDKRLAEANQQFQKKIRSLNQ